MSLTARWSRLVDARDLGTTRIIIGLAGIIKLFVVAPILLTLDTAEAMRLPWLPGFAPAFVAPIAVIGIWAAAAVAFSAGLRTRLAGTLLTAAATVTLVTDRQLFSNHLYLLIVLVTLLCVADAGAARSIDAAGHPRRVRALGPDLIRIQVTIVYVWAALWKLNDQFLSGWMIGISLEGGPIALPEALRNPDVYAAIAALTIVTELFVGCALWSRRYRPLAATLGILMHVAFVAFIALWAELLVFGLLMLGCYPLFFGDEGDGGDGGDGVMRASVISLPRIPRRPVQRPGCNLCTTGMR